MEKILTIAKEIIENNHSYFTNIKTGDQFEKLTLEVLNTIKDKYPELHISSIKDNGDHAFPDIKIVLTTGETYGVEVKFSNSGHWYSLGNSIFESQSDTSENAYKDIYLLFGRKPKTGERKSNLEVRSNLYSNVLKDIKVTHSPRFSIDMNQNSNSIFSEEVRYEKFRTFNEEEKIDFIQQYFSKNISENKWYINKQTQILPRLLSDIELTQRNTILAECYILFAYDLFGSTQANYDNIAKYLLLEYFIISSSLRDTFSSGGKDIIDILNNETKYSRIIINFYLNKDKILKLLNLENDSFKEKCLDIWSNIPSFEFDSSDSLLDIYLKLLTKTKQSVLTTILTHQN